MGLGSGTCASQHGYSRIAYAWGSNGLLTATERGVLQDVWDARVVWGVGLEADREDIVAVVAGDVQVFGARLVVPQVQCRQLELGNMLGAQESEAMELLARLGKLREVGRSPRSPLGRAAEHFGYGEERW